MSYAGMMSYGRAIWDAVQGNRGIAWGVWWNVGLLVLSLAAMPFDGRKILGLNPWVKPVKFDVSVIVFLVTVAVLMKALGDEPEWVGMRVWMGWGFGVAMIVEDTVIALQSARGVRSHMNFTTPLNAGLFGTMGVAILVSTLLSAWLLVNWCRTDAGLAQVVVWGIRLGLVMLLAASVEGVRMVAHGSHTVGAADGGPGLAFVNWSTGHGDLRVAHFFALHALQIFPVVGMVLASTKMRSGVQLGGLFGFVVAYAWVVWWMFAEAMKGVALVGA
jgi:hypothetical protein